MSIGIALIAGGVGYKLSHGSHRERALTGAASAGIAYGIARFASSMIPSLNAPVPTATGN